MRGWFALSINVVQGSKSACHSAAPSKGRNEDEMGRTYRRELAQEIHYACLLRSQCKITKSNCRECGHDKIVVVEEWPFVVKEKGIPAGQDEEAARKGRNRTVTEDGRILRGQWGMGCVECLQTHTLQLIAAAIVT